MDPLQVLPDDIRDHIFSKLETKDLKTASLVSKDWYNIIGQSSVCMKRLRIRKNGLDNEEALECTRESSRQYQCLTMIVNQLIINKNPRYLRTLREIFTKFSNSLVKIETAQDIKLRVDLPKLKELKLRYFFFSLTRKYSNNRVPLIASNGLITKATNLRKLTIECSFLDKRSTKYLKDALVNNKSLKILDVNDIHVLTELDQDCKGLELEELYLEKLEYSSEFHSIKGFISSQVSSLKIVKCLLNGEYIAYLMANCPQLHTMIICEKHFYNRLRNYYDQEYPMSQSLKKIVWKEDLSVDGSTMLNFCKIIEKTPNLQEVHTRYLIPEILPYFYNCTSLKVVKYNYLSYIFPPAKKEEIDHYERIEFIELGWSHRI